MAIESGTAYVYCADMKAAFDNMDKKKIVRMVQDVGLGKRLRRDVGEIYGEAKSIIVIREKLRNYGQTKG